MSLSGLTESKNFIQCQLMNENKLLVHKHLIVRAEVYRPPMDEEFLRRWLNEFIEQIGMKVMMGPYVKYSNMEGNRGITGAAIIETSHIVMHIWDEVHPALMQFDVYSCGEFDPETICKKIDKDFIVEPMDLKSKELVANDIMNKVISFYEMSTKSK